MQRLFRRERDEETYDPRTGLHSERYVRSVVSGAIASHRAFAMASIWAPVDELREQIVRRLGMNLRAEDVSAALGLGDQYVMVFFGMGIEGVKMVATRSFAGMSGLVVGFASFPGDGETFVDLVARANRRAVDLTFEGPKPA